MTESKEVLLLATGVEKTVKNQKQAREERILNAVDLTLYTSDFTIIMGASGAGKSTLLYVLSGMDHISAGKVEYRGKEISQMNEKQMAALRSKEFGFVFQQAQLVSNLSLLENVEVAGFLKKGSNTDEVRRHAQELLTQMNLTDAMNRLPAQVSGGEAQRAALARAVINRPGLLFADEPTGALNRQNTEQVLNLLTAMNQAGQSILMVTHDVRSAIRGNRLLYLEDGAIIGGKVLPAYAPNQGKEREAEINEWLTGLKW